MGTWTTERVTEIQLPTVVTKSNPHSEDEVGKRERSGPPVRLWSSTNIALLKENEAAALRVS